MNENIDYNGTPTRDALDKTMINLYRKAYYDFRKKRNPINKSYLEGIQDALMAIMGSNKYDKIKNRVKANYTKDIVR